LAEIAPDFPDTSFAWGTTVDTFKDKGVENVFAYTTNASEGGYVQGVMAAKLTKSKKIGVVGPIAVGDALLYVEGFKKGVKATDPSVEVLEVYTGSFSDVALASQAAQTHIDAGADILTGTGQMVVGAIGVAKEKKVLWFSTQATQASLAPEIVVSAQVYDWTDAIKQIISNVQKGTKGGEVYTLSLKNGGLKMEFNPGYKLADEVKAAADETIKGIVDGKIDATVSPEAKPAATAAPSAAPTEEAKPAATEEKAAATEAAAAPAAGSGEVFRIAVVTPSTKNDLAFSQSMYDALVKIQKEMGGPDKLEIAISESMFKVEDAAAAIRDYASQGYNLVIAHGSQYGTS
ncbi:MAG: BMP family ABC transporter substrate-binding protein, partial [Terriglobia bacterium]